MVFIGYHDNPKGYLGMKVLNLAIFILGLSMGIVGTYAAIVRIRDQIKSGGGVSFSCRDNSS
jgi:hypothetical protein